VVRSPVEPVVTGSPVVLVVGSFASGGSKQAVASRARPAQWVRRGIEGSCSPGGAYRSPSPSRGRTDGRGCAVSPRCALVRAAMMLDAALLLGLGGPIEPAPGEPAPVELRWQAVPGCPDRAAVEQALGALVRADSYAGGAQVSGRLEGELGSYALHLEIALASQREVRELRAHNCALL